MALVFLTLGEILEIHRDQISRYGGQGGIRDVGLLKSATAMPAAGIRDRYLHQDLYEMAAAYLFHIVRDHPFIDGNKRAGIVAALVFLSMNGYELIVSEKSLEDLVQGVAQGKINKEMITEYFQKNTKKT